MRTLFLTFAFVIGFIGCGVVSAQDLPVKMGLWEFTSATTNPFGKTNTTTSTSCITPASWQRMLVDSSKPRENCKIDTKKIENGYTVNSTCTVAPGITAVVTGTSKVVDEEHIVSDSHSVITMNGQKQEGTNHTSRRFLAADCGNVKADTVEPSHK